jgi:hypothetical protein
MPKPPPPPRAKPAPPGPAKPAKPAEPVEQKPPAESLAEVERALSVLHGRHPEAVRAERETQAALLEKRASSEAVASHIARQEKRAWVMRLATGAVVIALAGWAWRAYSGRAARGAAVEASLAPVVARLASLGFSRAAASRFAVDAVELSADESTCFVALASRAPGDGALRVERPSGTLEGVDSIAWCTCGAERATARLGTLESPGGLFVLRIPAAEVGGDQGLFFMDPRANVIAPPDECGGVSLDAWIDKGRAPVTPDDSALSTSLRSSLEKNGFHPVASARASLPFAVAPGTPETCILAWSTNVGDALSLRVQGGERPIEGAKGAIGACTEGPKSTTVWRSGSGVLVVERVAAARIGGVHGLREAASRLGFDRGVTWVQATDLGWDASSTLRASGVPAPEIAVSVGGNSVTHARLLALSIAGAMVRADGPDDAWACEPPLTRESTHAVCVQSKSLAWHVVGSVGKAGIAEATLPFWMSTFAEMTDPAALRDELAVLKLGRSLVATGFEATTLEGVTETPGGAEVTGRSGDDAIVALALKREAPWVVPCVLDGEAGSPWESLDQPSAIPLGPGEKASLVCGARRGESRDKKTVVFRHPTGAPPP